ncbi:MAG: helix-turn-helix transcriptional regulator, partial [Holophagales bacterium]|nr:helix-turn-helix transcriptional regulator [Holophagales bacterium]
PRFVSLERGRSAPAGEPPPALGGLVLEPPGAGSAGIRRSGTLRADPAGPIAERAVGYLLDCAVADGLLDAEQRARLDAGELGFEAGQVFFERGRITEIRLEINDTENDDRYGTDRRPLVEPSEEGLQLDPRDAERDHLSALLVEEAGGFAVGLAWSLGAGAGPSPAVLTPERLLSAAAAQAMYIPVNPPLQATLRAIYSGGRGERWAKDDYGRPFFAHETRDGVVQVFFDFENVPEETAIGALMMAVSELSVETADVFLILMSRIAELRDPSRDLAQIRLEEIADHRSVRLRRGHRSILLADLYDEVLRLADLRLTMRWKDYREGGTVHFGEEKPDRLFDIVDVSYEHSGRRLKGFSYRCGQALAYFLQRDSLRWVGRYSRALLELNPRREGFTKKVGTYWAVIGVIAGRNGREPVASIRSLLDFCGEPPNFRNPNRTVDRLIEAHVRLQEIGLLEEIPRLEPEERKKGYFDAWLDAPRRVRLSRDLWRVMQASDRARLPSDRRPRVMGAGGARSFTQQVLPLGMPESEEDLIANPLLIGALRKQLGLRQEDLGKLLDVSRKTIGRYEQGRRQLPHPLATRLLELWRARAGSADSPP